MSQMIKRALGLIAVVAAFAAITVSAATARVDIHPPGYSQGSQKVTPAPTTSAGSTSSSDAFDWGDAAIGAGVVVALIGLAGGVVLLARRGQQGRTRPATTS